MKVIVIGKVYDISDWKSYQKYKDDVTPLYEKYGVKTFLQSTNDYEVFSPEGDTPEAINILQFPNKKDLYDFYYSPEYQELIRQRDKFCRVELTFIYEREHGFKYD